MKTCAGCGQEKPLDEFYKQPSNRDGHFGRCKVCILADRRSRYEADGDLLRDRVRRYQKANPEKVRATREARRARRVRDVG